MKRNWLLALLVAGGAAGIAVMAYRQFFAPPPPAGSRAVASALKAPPDQALEAKLKAAEARAKAIDEENVMLVNAIKSNSVQPAKPPTMAELNDRLAAAKKMAENGQFQQSLSELLWLYSKGMTANLGASITRHALVLPVIGKMAAQYPEARTALISLRDEAEKNLRGSPEEAKDAASALGTINRQLNDPQRTFQAYDSLPPNDPARASFARTSVDAFIEAKRYDDVIQALPPAQMDLRFENSVRSRDFSKASNPVAAEQDNRDAIIRQTTRNIEVLAGAGKLDAAQALIDKLVIFDNRPATLALIQERTARAGQSSLGPKTPGR